MRVRYTGKDLLLMMRLSDDRALGQWKRELVGGAGIYAACETLGVSYSSLLRLSRNWPALRKVAKSGCVSPEERGVRGGKASQLAATPEIVARRNRAIRKAARNGK